MRNKKTSKGVFRENRCPHLWIFSFSSAVTLKISQDHQNLVSFCYVPTSYPWQFGKNHWFTRYCADKKVSSQHYCWCRHQHQRILVKKAPNLELCHCINLVTCTDGLWILYWCSYSEIKKKIKSYAMHINAANQTSPKVRTTNRSVPLSCMMPGFMQLLMERQTNWQKNRCLYCTSLTGVTKMYLWTSASQPVHPWSLGLRL